ncbi:MAG TPA: hypothetical protein VFH56_09795 [Acidimicrobiales bacterium]|nr:hypothetical protein [Acidimicrobiales bacterium]
MDKVTTTTVASSTVSTTHPVLSGSSLAALVGVLLFLALLVIISPSILSLLYNKRRPVNGTGATGAPSSFFQINYITWYLLHSTVAALVIIGVIILRSTASSTQPSFLPSSAVSSDTSSGRPVSTPRRNPALAQRPQDRPRRHFLLAQYRKGAGRPASRTSVVRESAPA